MNKKVFLLYLLIIFVNPVYTESFGQLSNIEKFGNTLIKNSYYKHQDVSREILKLYDYQFDYSLWPSELAGHIKGLHPDSVKSWLFIAPGDSLLIDRKSLSFNHSQNLKEFKQDTLLGLVFDPFGIRNNSERAGSYNYNNLGAMTSFQLKSDGGGILSERKWIYNDDGLLTEYIYEEGRFSMGISKTYHLNGSPKRQEKVVKVCQVYSYPGGCLSWSKPEIDVIYFNQEGIPESGYIIHNDSVRVRYNYESDESGSFALLKETRTNKNDSTIIKTLLKDSTGNTRILEFTHESFSYSSRRYFYKKRSVANYDQEGKRISGKFYRWDYDKKVVELQTTDSLIYGSSGELRYIHSFSWDDEFAGSDHLREYQYDEEGRLIIYSKYNRGFLNKWYPYEKQYYYHPNSVQTTKISETANDKITIYPNPAQNNIFITGLSFISHSAYYEIIDTRGMTVLYGSLNPGIKSIDVSRLNTGLYFINFYEEGVKKPTFTGKMIKQ